MVALSAVAGASPLVARRPFGLLTRLGIAAICLAVPLGYALTREGWVQSRSAVPQMQGPAQPVGSAPAQSANSALAMRRPAELADLSNVASFQSDHTGLRPPLKAARGEGAARKEMADQENPSAQRERARSTPLQGTYLVSNGQIDLLRTGTTPVYDRGEQHLQNQLAAARALDTLRRLAAEVRTLLHATTSAERQRDERLARDLSHAQARIHKMEADAAAARAEAQASLAQAHEALDDERQRSEAVKADLAEAESLNTALSARANATEQERTKAVRARQRAEQTSAEAERLLLQERAATASARQERDAASRELVNAVEAKERAQQNAEWLESVLAKERAATTSAREDLKHALGERDAARSLLLEGTPKLQQSLDEQREATVALARDLAAARATNDRLEAKRQNPKVKPALKPRVSSAKARTSSVTVQSQKVARSEVRTLPLGRRPITLPYSLRPRHIEIE